MSNSILGKTSPLLLDISTYIQVSKQVYRPPGARGTLSTFKLHDEEQEKAIAFLEGKKEDKQENLR